MKPKHFFTLLLTGLIILSCTESTEPDRKVSAPKFNPSGGTHHNPIAVVIYSETAGALIKYTTDGSEPDQSSTTYTAPIEVTNNTTIKAKAIKEGLDDSSISTDQFDFEIAELVFNPPGGEYIEPQEVEITCETEGAYITYTLDGSEPDDYSAQYTEPIIITKDITIKARAFKEEWTPTNIATCVYRIDYLLPSPEMVFVEGGTFNPTDDYIVDISSFYIAKYEITQLEWTSVMGGIYYPDWNWGNGFNYPAYNISWFDAIEYCNRLSMREGLTPCYSYDDGTDYGTNPDNWPCGWNTSFPFHTNVFCNWEADGYRLPTEMEREFAARGGVPAQNVGTFNYRWAGTNDEDELGDYAWYGGNSNLQSHPVGTKLPNELELYDMSGNVWNWVWDIRASYPTGSYNNPTGPETGGWRVFRGGSWRYSAGSCRVDNRDFFIASWRYDDIGFRVSRTQN